MRIFLVASLLLHILFFYFLYTSHKISLSQSTDVEVAIIERIAVAESSPTNLENENIVTSPFERIQKSDFPEIPVPTPVPAPVPGPAVRKSGAPTAVQSPPALSVQSAPAASVQSISSADLGLKAKYPRLSRMLSEEGRVVVMVHTNERGHVKKMSVSGTSGFARLDEAALEAVSNSRRVTYDKNSRIKISFLFKLK